MCFECRTAVSVGGNKLLNTAEGGQRKRREGESSERGDKEVEVHMILNLCSRIMS